jgi:hypothetical protein
MLKTITLLIVAGTLLPASGFSQSASDLRVGTRARVVTESGTRHTGTLASVSENAITLVPKNQNENSVALSMTQISRVQVSVGRNRARGALIDGLIGLGAGAVGGAVLGAITFEEKTPCSMVCFNRGESAFLAGILGGGAGLIVGTIAGAVTGREKWVDIPPALTH